MIAQQEWEPSLKQYLDHVLLYINQAVETVDPELIGKLRLIEIPDGPRVLERHRQLKEINGQAVIAVRLPLSGPIQ